MGDISGRWICCSCGCFVVGFTPGLSNGLGLILLNDGSSASLSQQAAGVKVMAMLTLVCFASVARMHCCWGMECACEGAVTVYLVDGLAPERCIFVPCELGLYLGDLCAQLYCKYVLVHHAH